MKNNTLVVCGGTGAHVALALVRLHTLGQPLGFFRDTDDKPLAFPTVYLVSLLRKACSAEFLPEAAGRARVSGRDAAFAG